MRRKLRKHRKAVLGFTALGATTSLGAGVMTGAGGSAAGLGNIGRQYPAMGTIMGSGMAIDMLGGMIPKKRKRRRR